MSTFALILASIELATRAADMVLSLIEANAKNLTPEQLAELRIKARSQREVALARAEAAFADAASEDGA